jgi:type I restriction enzyme R subunit
MPPILTESNIEDVALEILSELGYKILHGLDIAPDGINPKRKSYSDVVLVERLRDAVDRINPNIPKEAREEAIQKVSRTQSPQLIINNQNFHKKLVEGVDVEYRRKDGSIANDKVWLFELKNPADENATIWTAFNQIETYKTQIPTLFHYNAISVISDGIEARAGTITSNKERFMPWKTIEGKEIAPSAMPQLEVLFQGMFNKKILLDLIRHFIVFEQERQDIHKKLAAYH